jgi:hypothetical protein
MGKEHRQDAIPKALQRGEVALGDALLCADLTNAVGGGE